MPRQQQLLSLAACSELGAAFSAFASRCFTCIAARSCLSLPLRPLPCISHLAARAGAFHMLGPTGAYAGLLGWLVTGVPQAPPGTAPGPPGQSGVPVLVCLEHCWYRCAGNLPRPLPFAPPHRSALLSLCWKQTPWARSSAARSAPRRAGATFMGEPQFGSHTTGLLRPPPCKLPPCCLCQQHSKHWTLPRIAPGCVMQGKLRHFACFAGARSTQPSRFWAGSWQRSRAQKLHTLAAQVRRQPSTPVTCLLASEPRDKGMGWARERMPTERQAGAGMLRLGAHKGRTLQPQQAMLRS